MIHDVLNKKRWDVLTLRIFFCCFHSCLSQFLPKTSGFVVCGEHVQGGKNQLPTRLYIIFINFIYTYIFSVHPSRQPARNTKYQIPPPPKKNTKKSIEMVGFQFKDLQILTYFFLGGGGTSPRETSLLVRCQLSKLQEMPLNSNSVEVSGGLTGRIGISAWMRWMRWMDGTLMKNHVLQNIVIRIID